LQRRAPPQQSRTLVFGLGAGLAAALMALVILPERNTHTTGAGEVATLNLDDGSTVWLNADSRLRVDFSKPVRRVVLERGEAFFKVAHDAGRPFVVEAEPRRIIVTGTEFDVRRAPESVEVAVAEGHVKVEAPALHDDRPEAVTALSAGDDARFTAGQAIPAVVRGTMAQHKGAWREGKIDFGDGTPILAAVDEVNRYTRTKVILADGSLNQDTITGGPFWTGDAEQFVHALRTMHPELEVRREPGKIILSRPGG